MDKNKGIIWKPTMDLRFLHGGSESRIYLQLQQRFKEVMITKMRDQVYVDVETGKSEWRAIPIVMNEEQEKPECSPNKDYKLACDGCSCHPEVIYITSKGKFCEQCYFIYKENG